jgi:hypothetical protein
MKPSTRNKVSRKAEYLRGSVMGGKKKKNSTSNGNKKSSISSNTQTTEVANRTNRNSKRVSMGMKITKNQDSKHKNVKKTTFASVTNTSEVMSSAPVSPPTSPYNDTSFSDVPLNNNTHSDSVSVNPTNNRG